MIYDDVAGRAVALFRDGDEYRAAGLIDELQRSGDSARAAAAGRAIAEIRRQYGSGAIEIIAEHMETIRRHDRRIRRNGVKNPPAAADLPSTGIGYVFAVVFVSAIVAGLIALLFRSIGLVID